MYKKQLIGKRGENLVCEYLEKNNYIILEKNFSCVQGEIDIIAFDKGKEELVFFEVKTRTNFNYGFPAEAINIQKQKHMINSVKYYLYLKKMENVFVRIDVVEVVVNGKEYKLNHLVGVDLKNF